MRGSPSPQLEATPKSESPSPPAEGETQQWPTNGQIGYITLAVSGVTNASERGIQLAVAHKWVAWLHNSCRLGGPQQC